MQAMIETKPFSKRVLIILAGLCGIVFALGSVGFWKGYQAVKNAEMMRSYEWIHNERCLKKIANSPNPEVFKFAVFGDIQIGTAQLPRLIKVLKEKAPCCFRCSDRGCGVTRCLGPFYYLVVHFFGKFLPWSLVCAVGNVKLLEIQK
jgi:hypothetical protein